MRFVVIAAALAAGQASTGARADPSDGAAWAACVLDAAREAKLNGGDRAFAQNAGVELCHDKYVPVWNEAEWAKENRLVRDGLDKLYASTSPSQAWVDCMTRSEKRNHAKGLTLAQSERIQARACPKPLRLDDNAEVALQRNEVYSRRGQGSGVISPE